MGQPPSMPCLVGLAEANEVRAGFQVLSRNCSCRAKHGRSPAAAIKLKFHGKGVSWKARPVEQAL
jgi:hypothetical protein